MFSKLLDESNNLFFTLDPTTQTLVFQKWGEIGHGPKLYGCFRGGRVEEFIPNHTVNDDDLVDPVFREHFARKLANFHYMDVPVNKLEKFNPVNSGMIMLEKSETPEGQEYLAKLRKLADVEDALKVLQNFDWRKERDWLERNCNKVFSPEILAWNDNNRQNTLVREGHVDEHGHRVTLIDLELTSRNPRGCDFGNHFLFWYFAIDKPMGRSSLGYPSEEIR